MRRLPVVVLSLVGLVPLVVACGEDSSGSSTTIGTAGAAVITIPGRTDVPASSGSGLPPAAVGVGQAQGFGTATVVIRRADGSICQLCTYVARTEAEHERGLMQVTDLAAHDGMIFEFDSAQPERFWMKNTVMPLTAGWFGPDGAFLAAVDMPPCPPDTDCPSYGPSDPAQHVLEVPMGALASLRVGAGATLQSVTDGSCALAG